MYEFLKFLPLYSYQCIPKVRNVVIIFGASLLSLINSAASSLKLILLVLVDLFDGKQFDIVFQNLLVSV